jgi:simple sugar transport system permease protein
VNDAVAQFLEASVRTATPLALAALGEVLVERSGVINIGLEGAIIAGAFGALVGAGSGSVTLGFAAAAIAGVVIGAVAGGFIAWLRADQIVTGTAITLLGLGLTGLLYRTMYGSTGAGLTIPTLAPLPIPILSSIPWLGSALFDQPPSTYLVFVLAPLLWAGLFRTHAGLAIRACGESPLAATAAGINVRRIQFVSLVTGGLFGGLAGGTLVLAQSGTFIEGMSAGRGFIAIAIVVLGRWHPVGAVLAALLFGAAMALQYLIQAMGWSIPYQLVLATPYVLTLLALAGLAGRVTAPAALGRTEPDDV